MTGAIIGVVVGYSYSIRGSSGYRSNNGSATSYLMRAIVAASTARGMDVSKEAEIFSRLIPSFLIPSIGHYAYGSQKPTSLESRRCSHPS